MNSTSDRLCIDINLYQKNKTNKNSFEGLSSFYNFYKIKPSKYIIIIACYDYFFYY